MAQVPGFVEVRVTKDSPGAAALNYGATCGLKEARMDSACLSWTRTVATPSFLFPASAPLRHLGFKAEASHPLSFASL